MYLHFMELVLNLYGKRHMHTQTHTHTHGIMCLRARMDMLCVVCIYNMIYYIYIYIYYTSIHTYESTRRHLCSRLRMHIQVCVCMYSCARDALCHEVPRLCRPVLESCEGLYSRVIDMIATARLCLQLFGELVAFVTCMCGMSVRPNASIPTRFRKYRPGKVEDEDPSPFMNLLGFRV